MHKAAWPCYDGGVALVTLLLHISLSRYESTSVFLKLEPFKGLDLSQGIAACLATMGLMGLMQPDLMGSLAGCIESPGERLTPAHMQHLAAGR